MGHLNSLRVLQACALGRLADAPCLLTQVKRCSACRGGGSSGINPSSGPRKGLIRNLRLRSATRSQPTRTNVSCFMQVRDTALSRVPA